MDKIEEITSKLHLDRIDSTNLDISQIIFRYQISVNDFIARNNLGEIENLNTFAGGIRGMESNLKSRITQDDQIYLEYLTNLIETTPRIEHKIEYYFKKYDTLNLIRDKNLALMLYSTLEGNTPGALSQYIATRILEKDSNFILMIAGQVRSGKSMAGGKLGHNVSQITGLPLELTDVVYNHKEFLEVKKERRLNQTLKGSTQIIDEGGLSIDSQAWFEKEVKRIVNTLRTQGFDNSCTVIISPLFTDITAKARGLVHAILIPWKEWGKRYMELTDTHNIDYERGVSKWKLDFLDTDPMTNKTYRGKLKAGLGDIIQVEFELPAKKWITDYEALSKKFKTKLQEQQLKEIMQDELRENPEETKKRLAGEIKPHWDNIKDLKPKTKRNAKVRQLLEKYKIGRQIADDIIYYLEDTEK